MGWPIYVFIKGYTVSTDFASTWTQYTISPVSNLNAVSLSVDITGTLTVYACGDSGIWKFVPGSGSPTLIYNISSTSNPSSSFISIGVSDNGKTIAACKNRNSEYLYVSTDGGSNFSQKGGQKSWADVVVSSSGQYMSAIVNGEYVYKSVDYGQNFSTALTATPGWYAIAMSANANYVYAIAPWSNLYMYNAMMTTVSTSQISNPGAGSFYFDQSTNRLYVYNASTSAWKYVALS